MLKWGDLSPFIQNITPICHSHFELSKPVWRKKYFFSSLASSWSCPRTAQSVCTHITEWTVISFPNGIELIKTLGFPWLQLQICCRIPGNRANVSYKGSRLSLSHLLIFFTAYLIPLHKCTLISNSKAVWKPVCTLTLYRHALEIYPWDNPLILAMHYNELILQATEETVLVRAASVRCFLYSGRRLFIAFLYLSCLEVWKKVWDYYGDTHLLLLNITLPHDL